MKRMIRAAWLLLCVSAAAVADDAVEKKTHLFILSGQFNMAGLKFAGQK